MNFIDYTPFVLKLAKPMPHHAQVDHALLGMVTELGELGDMVKRHVIYDKPLDKTNGMEEIGDLFWYLALYCHEEQIDPDFLDKLVAANPPEDPSTSLVKQIIVLASTVGALAVPLALRGVPGQVVVGRVVMLLTMFCSRMGYTVAETLDLNYAKLSKRFATGAFSNTQAMNRDHAAERVVLEGGTQV